MRKFKPGALHSKPSDSFTLVELLVVMAIIAILAALILGAGNGVFIKGMRSRASTEISAMSTAAEGYKTDNGIYPQGDGLLLTNSSVAPYIADGGTTPGTEYQTNSTLFYIALSGQTNFATAPAPGTKTYMSFKANQVGNANSPYSYIADPWKNAYGYSTGTPTGASSTNYPYNGGGFFDLWSTASSTNVNTWLSNWTQ